MYKRGRSLAPKILKRGSQAPSVNPGQNKDVSKITRLRLTDFPELNDVDGLKKSKAYGSVLSYSDGVSLGDVVDKLVELSGESKKVKAKQRQNDIDAFWKELKPHLQHAYITCVTTYTVEGIGTRWMLTMGTGHHEDGYLVIHCLDGSIVTMQSENVTGTNSYVLTKEHLTALWDELHTDKEVTQ
ncbi:hypothetical protein ACRYI5_03340 [Furfurilactobacillus sp. WILCCON 0119]